MQLDPKVNILLVDDRVENLLSLEAVLSSLGENLVKAHSGEEALRRLLDQDFAVILLDVQMPGMNGFETADLIRNRPRSRYTPIIFLTAFSTSDEFVFRGYSSGAVDYLLKPIDPVILTSKVSVFVDLFRKNEIIKQQTAEVGRQAAQLKAINTELRQSEERFRTLSNCSPVGIFLLDTEGQCVYTNPRSQTICGFSFAESLGEGWMQFIHPDDRERAIADWINFRHEQQEESYEYRFQMPDGTARWTHVRATSMYTDEGKLIGYVGTIEDITQRKQVEAAREQVIREQTARQEAEAANRMKDEFLAVLSHELRTPLNAMMGWARLLRTQKLEKSVKERALETIERNAAAQAQLIEDILDVSKIIRGKLNLNQVPINLISIIEVVLDSVRPQMAEKSIQLETVLDASIGKVRVDPVRLQQVIWNLLSNAIKFTPKGGRVEVRLHRTEIRNGEWRVGSEESGIKGEENSQFPIPDSQFTAYAQIQVIDTGIGINPDFLPNVFDRFRQADSTTTRSHDGLGLGLAIVRHLVELHNGTVHAASLGEGKGATFTVHLPLIDEETDRQKNKYKDQPVTFSSNAEHSKLLSDSQPLEGIKILVVDDEADTLEFMTFALQQHGAIPIAAASVDEALKELNRSKPELLISDISMPEQDGYSLIRQVRELNATNGKVLPAIALTAYTRQEDYKKVLSEGFQAHLAKPIEITDLLEAIVNLLGLPQKS